MSLADEVRTVRQRVITRLRELAPLVREYEELVRLAGELGIDVPSADVPAGSGSSAARPAPAGRDESEDSDVAPSPSRPDRATRTRGAASTDGSRRRAAPRSDAEPERDARVLDALREKPGVTTAELADLLGVPATSLYRPVRDLTNAGTIVKRGRGLYVS